MKRTLWLVCAAVLLAAGTAEAQVAAPELTPAAPRYYRANDLGTNSATITADNPAALQWGGPSRAAFGLIKLDTQPTGAADQKYNGYFVGYRGVNDGWAFGLEHLDVKQDASGSLHETESSGHLSYQILKGLALGAGLDRGVGDTGAGDTKVLDKTLGLSVNLGETFYLGYAAGQDDLDNSTGVSATRSTAMIGVALRLKGAWNWHIAYDKLAKGDFDNGVGGGFDLTTFTLQVGLGNLLLGAQSVKRDPKGGGSEFKATVIDVGWVPEKGLTLSGRLSNGENTAGGGTITEKDRMLAAVVGYQF